MALKYLVVFSRQPVCRLLTHLCVFLAYLCVGAAIFQQLEGPVEEDMVSSLRLAKFQFADLTRDCVTGKSGSR